MKYVATTLALVMALAAVVEAQPSVTWNTGLSETMEGNVVWYQNGWQAQSFIGDAGAVTLPMGAAGARAFVLPTFISSSGVAFQDQGKEVPNYQINTPDINFNPIISSPAPVAASGGGSMMIVVRNKNWASAPGSDTVNFNLAVFSSAKGRTDPISFKAFSLQANDAAAYVSVPNIKYFNSPATTNYRVIIGGAPNQTVGTGTATIGGQAMWTKDVYGYDLKTTGHPSGANWSLIDMTLSFN